MNVIKEKENELDDLKLQFEKYKEVEKKKLELESKSLPLLVMITMLFRL